MLTIRGLQKAQGMQQRAHAAVQPQGARGQAVQYITAQAQRYMISIIHVDTGALRASPRIMVDYANARGTILLSPVARNPKSGQLTSVYGVYEHERGGDHAFMDRTAEEVGARLLQHGVEMIRGAIR